MRQRRVHWSPYSAWRPARLIGGRFVDVNTIPAIAVGRLEVLKEGASATYGSDAVGGVANFVTRRDFRGFELNVSHDYFDGAGDTTVAGIWGGRIGASSAVFSAERLGRQELQMEERPWTLDRLSTFPPGGRAGWSVLGNPGTFSVGAPLPWNGDVSDPRCTDFGGQDEGWTCRFRYAPYDNLIESQQHTRAFAELNGPLNDRVDYHVEGLWADAVIPNTTPSYGPVSISSSTLMEVAADHPGRQAFCAAYAGHPNADPAGECRPMRPGTSTAARSEPRDPRAGCGAGLAPSGSPPPSAATSRPAGGTPIGTSASAIRGRAATSLCRGSTGTGSSAPSAASAALTAASASAPTRPRPRACGSGPSTARWRARGRASTTTRSATPSSTPTNRARDSGARPIRTTCPPSRTPRLCGAGSTRRWTWSAPPTCSWPTPR